MGDCQFQFLAILAISHFYKLKFSSPHFGNQLLSSVQVEYIRNFYFNQNNYFKRPCGQAEKYLLYVHTHNVPQLSRTQGKQRNTSCGEQTTTASVIHPIMHHPLVWKGTIELEFNWKCTSVEKSGQKHTLKNRISVTHIHVNRQVYIHSELFPCFC